MQLPTMQLTSDQLRDTVENDIINPDISNEIQKLLLSKHKWSYISNICEASGHILIVIATILSFASGFYKDMTFLSFMSGCVNVASISLLKFSDYSLNESKERNKELDNILAKIQVEQPYRLNVSPINSIF